MAAKTKENFINDCCGGFSEIELNIVNNTWRAAIESVAVHSASDNNERDVICSDSMCDYCAKVETCNGFEDAGDCFVGRKLTPIS